MQCAANVRSAQQQSVACCECSILESSPKPESIRQAEWGHVGAGGTDSRTHAGGMGSAIKHPLPSGQFSALAPSCTLDWLRPIYDVAAFESDIVTPGPQPAAWSQGFTHINTEALAESGLDQAWCRALSRGLDLGVTSLPPPQAWPPENYSSLLEFGDLVEAKLQADIDRGVLEVIPEAELAHPDAAFWFHPLGAVPKGTADCRVVVDTAVTGLNAVIRDTIMKLHGVRSVLGACKPCSYGCGFDLMSGFNQEGLRRGHVNLVCIHTPSGRACRYRYLCFGLKCAPFLFQGTMMELRRVLIERGVVDCFIAVYIDDFTMVDVCQVRLEANRARFKAQMTAWGFVLHDEKESPPSQGFDCIGYTIDTVGLRLFLSEARCMKKFTALTDFMERASQADWRVPLYLFESIAGKLSHAASVIYGGRWHLRLLWKVRSRVEAAIAKSKSKGRPHRSMLVFLPADVQKALVWWVGVLRVAHLGGGLLFVKPDGFLDVFDGMTFPDPWSVPVDKLGALLLTVITIDASSSGMGFVIGDPNHPVFAYACLWSWAQALNTSN